MELTRHTVLITGGATGIGLALAKEFLSRSNQILICGRREEKLVEAARANPGIQYFVADISNSEDRKRLAEWAIGERVTMLVNNAGMQREIDLTQGISALDAGENECRINLEGTIYLTARLIPHLIAQKNSAIVNVSSGLGFVPLAIVPIYCATKAAIHSYSISLRFQLEPKGVRVFEVIPPTVDTELDRGARELRGQKDRGIFATDVAIAAIEGIAADHPEIAVGMAANIIAASRANFDECFHRMNSRR